MTSKKSPWYKRVRRWGQTNLTESDPLNCDIAWWRTYWRETRVQGIIVNAGGIVAYYPTQFDLHYQAEHLGERDLFGEFVQAGREEGLAILARMDSNRATHEFYKRHSDWFVVDADGEPLTVDGRYFSCVNSDYYKEYIPNILIEIIDRYRPDGFTDNSWTGVSRQTICHCNNCRQKFKKETGESLPLKPDWDDPTYRKWIQWSYRCRLENWDLFNQVTKQHGGPDCLWLGMVNANPVNSRGMFCDLKEIGKRSEIIMCDHQSRDFLNGFEQNSMNGFLLHGLAGWEKIVPESMANYSRGVRTFRLSSNPTQETRLWMIEGFAGGISPWYHHIGAVPEDKRQFAHVPPLLQWHADNEDVLYDRSPVAPVGLVWSQENIEFYGRNETHEKVSLPWRGFTKALTRARIPFMPVHADHILRDADQLSVLVLTDMAAMSDSQCEAVKKFVESGGSIVFTGATATLDEEGNRREEFPFSSFTGIRHLHVTEGADIKQSTDWAYLDAHNYFRLPERRHETLSGFEDTDILPFGGRLHRIETDDKLQTVATYIPAFPVYPPEFSWMRTPNTDIPVLLAGEHPSGGRIYYFAGDVDRCYGRTHLPDLGDLLANAVRWAAKDSIPLRIDGPGYLDCKLYRQGERWIVHLINLSAGNPNPGFVEQLLPVGPIEVNVRTGADAGPTRAQFRVSGVEAEHTQSGPWTTVTVPTLVDHELIVIE